MAPWERYQQQSGPWSRYAADAPPPVSDPPPSATDPRPRVYIDGQPGHQAEPAQDQRPGFWSFVNRGIAGGLGAPVDLVNAGLGFVGLDTPEPFLGSSSIGRGMRALGIDAAPQDVQPDSLTENIAAGLGGAAGSLIPGAGIVSAMGRAASPVVSGIAETLSRPFMATPGRALTAEAAAGAGSGAGEDIAKASSGGDPYAQLAGSLLGGVAAGMGPSAAIRTVQALPVTGTALRLAQGEILPFTEAGAMQRARSRVRGLSEDPETARTMLDQPTVAQLSPAVSSGDRRLMALEQAVRDQEPSIDRTMRGAETEAAQTLRGGVEDIGAGGDIANTRDFLSNRVQGLVDRMDQRVARAEADAQRRVAALAPGQSASQASTVVREELEGALTAARQQERDLWQAIPDNEVVPVEGAFGRYRDLLTDLPRAQRDDMPEAARRFLGEGNEAFQAQEPVREIHGLYSALRQEARNARAGDTPNRNRARLADSIADALLDDMSAAGGASQPLRDALAFSRQLHERFTRGSVGRVLGNERTGGDRVADIQTLDATVGRPGRAGAVGYDELARALAGEGQQTPQAVRDYTLSRFRDAAVRDDGLRASQAATFLRSNEDTLARMPDVQRRIADALMATGRAERTADTMAARTTGIERRSAASTLTGSRYGEEIGAVLRSQNPRETAAQLVRQARRDTTGEASRGLKSAVVDDLLTSARTGRFDDADMPVMSGRALRSRLEDRKFGAVAGEILTPEEMGRVRRIADEFSRLETMGGRLPDVGPIMGDQPNSIISYLARVMAAKHGAALGGGTSGASLQTASLASRKMQRLLERLTNDKAEQLIIQAVSGDKELFDALLRPMGQLSKQKETRLIEAMTGIIGSEEGRK